MAIHRFHNPSTMPATRGYTHVVETRSPSRTLYIAGQLGMTPDGKFAGGEGDFRAQATQCFENLKLALAAAGANFEHVVNCGRAAKVSEEFNLVRYETSNRTRPMSSLTLKLLARTSEAECLADIDELDAPIDPRSRV